MAELSISSTRVYSTPDLSSHFLCSPDLSLNTKIVVNSSNGISSLADTCRKSQNRVAIRAGSDVLHDHKQCRRRTYSHSFPRSSLTHLQRKSKYSDTEHRLFTGSVLSTNKPHVNSNELGCPEFRLVLGRSR